MHNGLGRAAALVAAVMLAVAVRPSGDARAYAPEAAAAIARRMPEALPPGARWNPAWGDAAASAVLDRARAVDEDPESAAATQRFVARPGAIPFASAPSEGADAVHGRLPARLVAAHAALRDALAAREDDRIIVAFADIAAASAALANPFQVTSTELEEIETARHRFSDVIAPEHLADLAVAPWDPPDDAHQGALELAEASALEREAIERAFLAGDVPALESARGSRLAAALTLALAVTDGAWRAAGAPTLDPGHPTQGALRVAPHPVQSFALATFALPHAGAAVLEVFDLAGRRVAGRALGPRPAGLQSVSIGGATLGTLEPGLYLVRITAPGCVALGRMVRVR